MLMKQRTLGMIMILIPLLLSPIILIMLCVSCDCYDSQTWQASLVQIIMIGLPVISMFFLGYWILIRDQRESHKD